MPDAVDVLLDAAAEQLTALSRSVAALSSSVRILQTLVAAAELSPPVPRATTPPVVPPEALPRAREPVEAVADRGVPIQPGPFVVLGELLSTDHRRRADRRRRREVVGLVLVLVVVVAIVAIPLLLWL